MLLIDLSSIVIPEILQLVTKEKMRLNDDLVRRVTISQIINYRNKYNDYGKVVICADSKNYWRRDIYPYYKQNRKKLREKSKLDWQEFFICFSRIKDELKQLTYKYMEIEKMEADDIIAVLTKRYAKVEPIMIISADKDLIQLHRHGNVKQFSPQLKKSVEGTDKDYSLLEHIIRGDSSDGIPNILSDDDVFMCETKRQKSIRKAFIEEAKKLKNPEMIAPNAIVLDKYNRNRILIDLDQIPQEYRNSVVNSFETKESNFKKVKILNYLIEHKLKNIIEKLNA